MLFKKCTKVSYGRHFSTSADIFRGSKALEAKFKKLKSYIEVMLDKDSLIDLNLTDVKKYYTLLKSTHDLIEGDVIQHEDLENNIGVVVEQNNDKEENFILTKFLYEDYQLENNSIIFKKLISNIFNIKTGHTDSDRSILDDFEYYSYNFGTVSPLYVRDEPEILNNLILVTKKLGENNNYKGVSTEGVVQLLNIYPTLNIDLTNTDIYRYHSACVYELIYNKQSTIDINMYSTLFDFFLKYKDIDKSVTFSERLKIKEHMRNEYMKAFNYYIGRENQLTFIPIRFDNLIKVLHKNTREKHFQSLCEYIINLKMRNEICPLNVILSHISFRLKQGFIDKFTIHFVAFNTSEHLRSKVSFQIFEEQVIIIYGFLCANSYLLAESQTVKDFYEEFKLYVYHNKTISDKSKPINLELYNLMKYYHSKLVETAYYDQAFSNYLDQMIRLNKQLNII
jgi:hypothetical protein